MTAPRFDRLDALRGAAIVWMAVFHFGFDLNYYRLLTPVQNLYADPFWTVQRAAIVTLFMFTAGLSQAVAQDAGQGWPRFWKRWAQIAGCALLVSAGSALMFPKSWISFGVLHGFAVMLVLARVAAPLLATAAFQRLGHSAPFYIAGTCIALAGVLALQIRTSPAASAAPAAK